MHSLKQSDLLALALNNSANQHTVLTHLSPADGTNLLKGTRFDASLDPQ